MKENQKNSQKINVICKKKNQKEKKNGTLSFRKSPQSYVTDKCDRKSFKKYAGKRKIWTESKKKIGILAFSFINFWE